MEGIDRLDWECGKVMPSLRSQQIIYRPKRGNLQGGSQVRDRGHAAISDDWLKSAPCFYLPRLAARMRVRPRLRLLLQAKHGFS